MCVRVNLRESVYNIKRRIASLPPISLEEFNTLLKGDTLNSEEPSSRKSSSDSSSRSDEEQFPEDHSHSEDTSPSQCLFCSEEFRDNDDGFAANIGHMNTMHGMSIPSQKGYTTYRLWWVTWPRRYARGTNVSIAAPQKILPRAYKAI
jgi:pre-60S factor REI1